MYSVWTRHLTNADEKAEFEKFVRGSKRLLDRIKEVLTEQLDNQDASENTIKAYDNPNWAYKQAHRNGVRSTIQSILKFIDLDQQMENK